MPPVQGREAVRRAAERILATAIPPMARGPRQEAQPVDLLRLPISGMHGMCRTTPPGAHAARQRIHMPRLPQHDVRYLPQLWRTVFYTQERPPQWFVRQMQLAPMPWMREGETIPRRALQCCEVSCVAMQRLQAHCLFVLWCRVHDRPPRSQQRFVRHMPLAPMPWMWPSEASPQ